MQKQSKKLFRCSVSLSSQWFQGDAHTVMSHNCPIKNVHKAALPLIFCGTRITFQNPSLALTY